MLHASGKFRLETDVSTIRALIVDRRLHKMCFLRATRRNGTWAYEFPDSVPGSIRRNFLQEVTEEIEKLLHTLLNPANAERPSGLSLRDETDRDETNY